MDDDIKNERELRGADFFAERKKRNYTQKEVAELISCSPATVNSVEAGKVGIDSINTYMTALVRLPIKPRPNKVVYTEEQVQLLREQKNAAARELVLRNKILRYAQAGMPIDHLLKGAKK